MLERRKRDGRADKAGRHGSVDQCPERVEEARHVEDGARLGVDAELGPDQVLEAA